MRILIGLLLSMLCLDEAITQDRVPKVVDGFFSDWNQSDFTVEDADAVNGLNITSVSIDHDAMRLYILLELDQEIDLQEEEDIAIFIDADNDPSTGFQRAGIGSEISYYFGRQHGFCLLYTSPSPRDS